MSQRKTVTHSLVAVRFLAVPVDTVKLLQVVWFKFTGINCQGKVLTVWVLDC